MFLKEGKAWWHDQEAERAYVWLSVGSKVPTVSGSRLSTTEGHCTGILLSASLCSKVRSVPKQLHLQGYSNTSRTGDVSHSNHHVLLVLTLLSNEHGISAIIWTAFAFYLVDD